MESLELLKQVNILSAHVKELAELIASLRDEPVLRGKILVRLNEQTLRLNTLIAHMN